MFVRTWPKIETIGSCRIIRVHLNLPDGKFYSRNIGN